MRRSITKINKNLFKLVNTRAFSTEVAIEYWFPRTVDELDSAKYQHSIADEFNTDFIDTFERKDEGFQQRIQEIKALSNDFTPGQRIRSIKYTDDELALWKDISAELDELHQEHACTDFLTAKRLLTEKGFLNSYEIPQLEELNVYLQKTSGFTLRPASRFLGPRQFLNSLAFNVFYTSQFIRPVDRKDYSLLPDVVNSFLGHAPLISLPMVSELLQDIGLASLGISDKEIWRLYAIYWYTIEQGLITQDSGVKVTGGHLLGNTRQLKKFGEKEFSVRGFNLIEVLSRVDGFELPNHDEHLFVTESYMSIKDLVREFSTSCKRPFKLYVNSDTHEIDVRPKTNRFDVRP